jgi:hypothetical protein
MVVKTLSESSWLISYYLVNVNISQHLIISMAGNDNSWLMLTLAGYYRHYPNVNITRNIYTLTIRFFQSVLFVL